ncbi:NRDE family protein [Spongiibacter sp. KMU-158]|uniref:NRDE family protein n=1 Tax=Spongiibacter pelagi TaxID=2760804 RepID=A0A927GUR9_9GAMM|nr:NRDE family protein [Spongiibacter pelagi]MBD2857881.1 NRDE family protein [Spongiibacter pelagi]
MTAETGKPNANKKTMCLIFLSWQQDSTRPLIVAANRDEFFARPTLAAHFWHDQPEILGGRDQEYGGSWLAIQRNGRFAAVTNLREVPAEGERSRGQLVQDFLLSQQDSAAFLAELEPEKNDYRPFNLAVCDGHTLAYSNNIAAGFKTLERGQYVLGNIALTQQNPKTQLAQRDLAKLSGSTYSREALFSMLMDDTITTQSEDDFDRVLSTRFVRSPEYGTRSSCVVFQHRDGRQEFWERNYGNEQRPLATHYFSLSEGGEIIAEAITKEDG